MGDALLVDEKCWNFFFTKYGGYDIMRPVFKIKNIMHIRYIKVQKKKKFKLIHIIINK
jgi:hypothetical protein